MSRTFVVPKTTAHAALVPGNPGTSMYSVAAGKALARPARKDAERKGKWALSTKAESRKPGLCVVMNAEGVVIATDTRKKRVKRESLCLQGDGVLNGRFA